MKRLIFFVVFFVLPVAVFGHPGKTDKYGGHNCVKDCEEWKLSYKEYHLHDKDWKPIRVNRKKIIKPFEPGAVRTSATESFQELPLVSETTKTITIFREVTTSQNIFLSNPLIWVLLILLLLLLILRLNRKRSESR